MSRYQTNNLLGIGLMMLAMLLFEVMDAFARWLVGGGMSAIQGPALRGWIIVPFILPVYVIHRESLHQRAAGAGHAAAALAGREVGAAAETPALFAGSGIPPRPGPCTD